MALLASHGHRINDIPEYTLAQIAGFMRAISQQRKQEVIGMATAISLALGDDKDALQKFLAD